MRNKRVTFWGKMSLKCLKIGSIRVQKWSENQSIAEMVKNCKKIAENRFKKEKENDFIASKNM